MILTPISSECALFKAWYSERISLAQFPYFYKLLEQWFVVTYESSLLARVDEFMESWQEFSANGLFWRTLNGILASERARLRLLLSDALWLTIESRALVTQTRRRPLKKVVDNCPGAVESIITCRYCLL